MKLIANVCFSNGEVFSMPFLKGITAGDSVITISFANENIKKAEIMVELDKVKRIEFEVDQNEDRT